MEITRTKSGDFLRIRLVGRMDASWCGHVENALSEAIREGEHRIHLDMSGISYLSSLGIRALLTAYKQLRSIQGVFWVVDPSDIVRNVLGLSGLGRLIGEGEAAAPPPVPEGDREFRSARAIYEIYALGDPPPMKAGMLGDPDFLNGNAVPKSAPGKLVFEGNRIALGVGGLGPDYADCAPRLGEFLALAGVAAYQPSDGSSRPDFMVSDASLRPEGFLLAGCVADGAFGWLVRFEATRESRCVPLSELASAALSISGRESVVMAAVTETSGLVGASLRRSPAAPPQPDPRFGFPQIRDWISFTSERAYRDTTSLVVGFASRTTNPLAPMLRPLGTGVSGHFHAASFPYRPLQKGRIELKASVTALFDAQNLQAVLHLLSDPRTHSGAGESEFYRGAMWIAPLEEASLRP